MSYVIEDDKYSLHKVMNAAGITVFTKEDRLYLEANNTRAQMHPLSESEFYMMGRGDVLYDFQRGEDGEVSGVLLKQGEFRVFVERR